MSSPSTWSLEKVFKSKGSSWVSGPRGEMARLPYEPEKRSLAIRAIDKLLTGQIYERRDLIDEPFIIPAPEWQAKFLKKLAYDKAIERLGTPWSRKYQALDVHALNRIKGLLLESDESISRHGYGNRFTLTPSLRNYLDGHLLGDGHYSKINSGGMCSAFQLAQCLAHSSWVSAVAQRLSKEGVKYDINGRLPSAKSTVKNAGPSILLRTRTYRTLKAERLRWYPSGKKIVPSDICLEDPILLAQWYMGDGSCQQYSHRLLLASHGFALDENVFLRDKLQKILGNQVYIIQQGAYASLGIKGRATEVFLDMVRPHLDLCFLFKGKSVWNPLYCVTCHKLIELRQRFARYCLDCTWYKGKPKS